MKQGFSILLLPAMVLAVPASAQPEPHRPAPISAPQPPETQIASYADLADLALAGPVAAHVRLRRILPLSGADAAGVTAGFTRFYLEAEVVALIRGAPGMPVRVQYIVDLANEPDGRPPRPRRASEWIIFARPVAGHAEQLQLVRAGAQLPFSPELVERVRLLVREVAAADAPPAITGIGRAFHTPGPLPATGETQIFLQTAQGRPISVTIARTDSGSPRWFVSTSEFVDAGATQPREGTLLWYRLACSLPDQLPPASTADAGEYQAQVAADYRLFREGLGRCQRLRRRG
jgi:hypothetical protein